MKDIKEDAATTPVVAEAQELTQAGKDFVEGKPIKVTSDVTIDFTGGWGIHAGEIRELPEDQEQRENILSNDHITIIK